MSFPVFVFGSNLAGRHGMGAALTAVKRYGAKYGVGEGLQGNSYAIPTKDMNVVTLPLEDIQAAVERFLFFACCNPNMTFNVTKIGCGLAGYSDQNIAPMFKDAPSNCFLHPDWVAIIKKLKEENT